MALFRKKPVVIEAVQWTGLNTFSVLKFIGQEPDLSCDKANDEFQTYCSLAIDNGLTIQTLEDGKDGRAKHVATVNDWIIKGVQGEFYPCKPDIFEATYESVSPQPTKNEPNEEGEV